MTLDLFNLFGKDPGLEPLPRNRMVAFHICWAALVPAFCYMYLADAPLFFLLALPFAAASLLVPKSARLNARTKIYSFVGPLVIISLIDLVYKVNMGAYFMTISVISPLLVFYAIATSFLDQRPISVVTALAASLGAMLLQGMTISNPDMVQMSAYIPDIFPTHRGDPDKFRFSLFILGILAQSYSILQLPKHALMVIRDSRGEAIDLQLKRAAMTIIATLILFATATGVSVGSVTAYKAADGLTHPLYLDYVRRHQKQSLFRSRISTDATLEWKIAQQGKRPALYISGEEAPGYLRGRAYQTYSGGEWRSSEVKDSLTGQYGKQGLSAFTWTKGGANAANFKYVDVIPAGRFQPEVVYAPGNITGLQAICDGVRTNSDGIYALNGWDKSAGYRYLFTEPDQFAATQSPTTPDDSYLSVSEPAASVVFMLARNITEGCTTDEERAYAIRDHFLREFNYTLKGETPKDEDPVVYFLRSRKEGHCELFASATVMMLRSLAIKARYVTGFVCFERQVGNTYVARYRDAHAWAEVWLPEKGWVIIESTPASGVPQGDAAPDMTRYTSAISVWLKNLLAGVKRGYFAQAVIKGLIWAWTYVKLLFLTPAGIISWPIVLLLVFIIRKQLRQSHSVTALTPYSQEFSQLKEQLLRFLKAWDIAYSGDMSMRDITMEARLRAIPDMHDFLKFMAEYERLRYSGKVVRGDLESFSDTFRKWLRDHSKG